MPIPHPRRRVAGGGHLLEPRGPVRDWAPPGWYWEVLPSGQRSLVRSQPVVDPEVLWWRPHGPRTIRRLESPAEVVQYHVSKENEHVRRYMAALEARSDNTWQILQGSHWSYDPVMVPSLWVSTARPDIRRALGF